MFGIQIATVFEQCHFRMAAQVKIKNMAFTKKTLSELCTKVITRNNFE